MKKLLTAVSVIGFGTFLFYHYIFNKVVLRLSMNNEFPLSIVIFSFCWIFLALMIFDLIYRKFFSRFIAPALYLIVFFTAKDALWVSELLWNRNYLLVGIILAIYALSLLAIVYRFDPKFKWITKGNTEKKQNQSAGGWDALSLWNKIVTVIGLSALTIFALYVPYKVILVSGYLINATPIEKRAKVIGHGESHGKYFHHRYWVIELDGKQEKFWVYAAANTTPAAKNNCATHTDPELGSTLVMMGRQGIFGFSFDRVVRILDAQGEVICD